MKIEPDKVYLSRNGKVFSRAEPNTNTKGTSPNHFPWKLIQWTSTYTYIKQPAYYTDDGRATPGVDRPDDLVKEITWEEAREILAQSR